MEIRRLRWLIFRSRVEGRSSFESLYYGPQLVVSRNAAAGDSLMDESANQTESRAHLRPWLNSITIYPHRRNYIYEYQVRPQKTQRTNKIPSVVKAAESKPIRGSMASYGGDYWASVS
jgi:hypothetical protein